MRTALTVRLDDREIYNEPNYKGAHIPTEGDYYLYDLTLYIVEKRVFSYREDFLNIFITLRPK